MKWLLLIFFIALIASADSENEELKNRIDDLESRLDDDGGGDIHPW